LICVIAVACLNFSIPQRNRIIFVVCEACFISTTFKYLGAVLLNAGGTTEEDAAMLGIMLVALDVMTMLGGGIAAIAILLNVGLKAKGSKTNGTKKGELTAVTLSSVCLIFHFFIKKTHPLLLPIKGVLF